MTNAQFDQTDQKQKKPMAHASALNKVNEILTSEVVSEAQAELGFMNTAMSEIAQLPSPETFMSYFLDVRRLIFKLENYLKVVRLGEISMVASMSPSRNNNLKIAIAFVSGMFASMS